MMLTMVNLEAYQSSYSKARSLFLATVTGSGGTVTSHLNDGAVGPDGEELYCDVASFGNPSAKRALFCISGTHGIEGGVGSAIFVNAIQRGIFEKYLENTRIILVHSINPWGHAHDSRCTENNVDLNRNFITHGGGYAENADYLKLHDVCTPEDWDEEAFRRFMDAYNHMAKAEGQTSVVNALFRGQYDRAEGLQFGGRGAEWSNGVMRKIAQDHKGGLEKAAFIDWHTGLGDYGQPLYFCLDETESPTYKRMHQWHGDEFLKFSNAFSGGEVPQYNGILMNAVGEELAGVELCKMILEFGTKSNEEIFRAFLIDRWIRFEGQGKPEKIKALKADIMECYCPQDQGWRRDVLGHSVNILEQSLSGLQSW